MNRQLIINGEILIIKKTKKMGIKIGNKTSRIQWKKICSKKVKNKWGNFQEIAKIYRKKIDKVLS
jgi:hypothetical protein